MQAKHLSLPVSKLYKRVHHVQTLPDFIQDYLLNNWAMIEEDEFYLTDELLMHKVADEAQTLAYILGIDSHILQLCTAKRQY